jgi:hypothetical protein
VVPPVVYKRVGDPTSFFYLYLYYLRETKAPILLGYEPAYKSFQKGPTVKDSRQAEVIVSRPGKDQEDIIEAVSVTVRREVQIPELEIPSVQFSEVRPPIIGFPSIFDPSPIISEDIPIQRRSINLGSVLGSLALRPPKPLLFLSPPGSLRRSPL